MAFFWFFFWTNYLFSCLPAFLDIYPVVHPGIGETVAFATVFPHLHTVIHTFTVCGLPFLQSSTATVGASVTFVMSGR